MPHFDEKKPFCIKCWNEPDMSNPLTTTVIVIIKGESPKYRDLCKLHTEMLQIWLGNKKKQFPNSGYKNVSGIEIYFTPEQIQQAIEEKRFPDERYEVRKKTLGGNYIE